MEATPSQEFADLSSPEILPPGWVNPALVDQVAREVTNSGKVLSSGDDRVELSVVIPTRDGQPRVEALKSVLGCRHFDGESMEIILTLGNHPSVQRNMAVSMARGRLVGFLDDDCVVANDWMTRAVGILDSDGARMAGGPNLTPDGSSFFSRCLGRVLSSRWGTAMMRARYAPVGGPATVSGDERTALCNMVFDKELLDEFPFDERLFPNEENELIVRLNGSGHKLTYDPELTVTHPRKESFGGFVKQFFGYGSGRAWQTKIQPHSLRPVHLMPSLTLLGLLAFPITSVLHVGPPLLTTVLGSLLLIYLAIVAFSSALIGAGMRSLKGFLLSMVLYPGLHLSYGLGFLTRIMVPRGRDRSSEGRRTWMLRLAVKAAGH